MQLQQLHKASPGICQQINPGIKMIANVELQNVFDLHPNLTSAMALEMVKPNTVPHPHGDDIVGKRVSVSSSGSGTWGWGEKEKKKRLY